MKKKNEYDALELVEARKNQQDPWVMYLVVRKSLNMSPGKTAAQVGHAVQIMSDAYYKLKSEAFVSSKISQYVLWKEQSYRKVVLVATENQWTKLLNELECYVVTDAGLTELEPGTDTVIGLWPMKRSIRPKIISKLQVLK